MRILYIGMDLWNSRLQRQSMERLGHSVVHVDPYQAIWRASRRWSYHTGNLLLERAIDEYIRKHAQPFGYDIAFVDAADMVPASTARWLKTIAHRTILFCRDNPFTRRDGQRYRLMRQSLPHFDLFLARRESNVEPARTWGARNIRMIIPPADEIAHRPVDLTEEDRRRFGSEVCFVGTWMPERGPFIERLMERGVPVRVFGPRWERARNFDRIRPVVTLGPLDTESYTKAISAAKICLALLSRGNADLHTARSVEIPAIGRLLCAERTSDHLMMFREGEEAVLWSDADECADACLQLLQSPDRIEQIAEAGRARVIADKRFNEPTWASVFEAALSLPA